MATLTRVDWTLAAFHRLSEGGVDAVRIEPLAKDLGVSKGSFYWHFEDRQALLTEMLTFWREQGTQAIIEQIESETTGPRERIYALTHLVFGQQQGDRAEVALRAWAARDEQARQAVRAVDEARTSYVTSLLIAAGVPKEAATTRTAIVYRTLLGEFLLRRSGGEALSKEGIDAVVANALESSSATSA